MTQVEIFEAFMRGVWDNALVTTVPDGGDFYDYCHHAGEIAQVLGAKPTGQKSNDDADWNEWLFPDGSVVWIMGNGSGTTNALP